jgi:CRP/FNR family transcriptional regulator, transcriptional activator FtrB
MHKNLLDTQIMMTNTDFSLLKSIPAFASVDESILSPLVASGTIEDIATETILFEQGQSPESLFVLLRGMVALTSASQGSCTTVDILKPVEQFQLSAVLLGASYLVTAQALQPSRILRIRADVMRNAVESEPELALASARYLSSLHRHVVREVLHLKLRSVTQRLASYLLLLLPDGGETRLPFGKRRLASRLGASPEHLSRAFATLRQHGVTTRGSWVTVSDADALSLFAAPHSQTAAPANSTDGYHGGDRTGVA